MLLYYTYTTLDFFLGVSLLIAKSFSLYRIFWSPESTCTMVTLFMAFQ